MTMMVMLSR